MSVRSDIGSRQARRRETADAAVRAADAALRLPAAAPFDGFGVGTVFKKTPCVADLKLGGRDVAKDIIEVGGIPLLMKTLPDLIAIIAAAGTLDVKLSTAGQAERKTKWQPRPTKLMSGVLRTSARWGVSAVDGAVTRGGAHEKQCYADI